MKSSSLLYLSLSYFFFILWLNPEGARRHCDEYKWSIRCRYDFDDIERVGLLRRKPQLDPAVVAERFDASDEVDSLVTKQCDRCMSDENE